MLRNYQNLSDDNWTPPDTAIGIGGAVPSVQARADSGDDSGGLMQRIYAPSSLKDLNVEEDERYGGKSDNVENIYLPAADQAQQMRSTGKGFFAEMAAWLSGKGN